ncbi:MAG: DHH family phosphoesterase [Candidatus Altimarinota bacterium]
MNRNQQDIINMIESSQNILIMPSTPVDGDSIGSSLALYLGLKKLGKPVTVVCADPIPEVYQFLPMMNAITDEFTPNPDFIVTLDTANSEIDSIQSHLENNKVNIIITAKKGRFSANNVSFSHGPNKYDLLITVDTASLQQLGRFYFDNVPLFTEIPVINIDHHASNERFGRINHVDIMSSSTTEMIQSILEELEEKHSKELIDAEVATLLMAGIITDTGSFQHSNTTPRSFSNAAKLIRRGARQQEIIQHVYKTKHLSTLRLWGRVLSNIKVEKPYRFLWSVITKKDFMETASKADETGNIIDELMSNAPDTDIVLLLKEKEGNVLSGSVRVLNDQVDASEIAAHFGGGGHTKAAGFKVKDSDFEKAGPVIIEHIKHYQATRLKLNPDLNQNNIPEETPPQTGASKVTLSNSKSIPTADSSTPATKSISKNSTQSERLEPGTLYKFES